MSKKKNYRAMYNENESVVRDNMLAPIANEEVSAVNEVVDEISTEVPVEVSVDPVVEVETEEKCEIAVGIVTGCSRLNVREAPEIEANVICTVPVWSEVQVCMTHDHGIWYHVYTAAGQEGYCMKQFININH